MNYMEIRDFDTSNGDGIRVSLFVSGCTLHCKGCFNPESWAFNAGKPFTEKELDTLVNYVNQPYISGLSILGGDPFEDENKETVLQIVKTVREKCPNKTIWIWTGRMHERLIKDSICKAVLDNCDVLIDGPFVEKLKITKQGQYKGSTNQRLICLKPSL